MQRLSGMDATFVHMETPDMHLHVVGTIVLDPSTMPGGYSVDTIKRVIAERIHLIPPFRRKLVIVPFNLGNPLWVDDADFDLDAHIHRIGVPAPYTMRELAEVVNDVASRPLDRARPLWEMWVVEGLEDGHVALVSKIHHCAIDGVTGADMMVHLFDLAPEGAVIEPPGEWRPETRPSDVKLLADAVASTVSQPVRLARMLVKTGQGLASAVQIQRNREDGRPGPTLPFTAPQTPFNGAITGHRAVAFGRASLEDMKLVKNAFGTTVNDVVLAASTMALRRWLIDHGGLPDKSLVASVPISVHGETSDDAGTNRVSAMMVSLPILLDDPVEQLLAIHEDTKNAKEVHRALGADTLTGLAEFAPPRLLNQASRLYSRLNLADRHRPVHNLVISNVPGPPIPLYCAGGRVLATYPMGPILEGAGLNLTVLSNMGNVDFGAIACREMVPDLWDIATGFENGVDLLRKAAEQKS
ncbi:MAG: WS/DGAT/MGAT family O-acyltransferase [Actinomycetota bacterium]